MSALPDPKPFKCVNCSDRFATTRSTQHEVAFSPRARYLQDESRYPHVFGKDRA